MPDFIQIPREFLAEIATGSERIPSLYYHKNWFIREFFWLRLRFVYRRLLKYADKRGKCLDFGGGSGVFLPTLAGLFTKVVCIDLEIEEAGKVVKNYDLRNVILVQKDIREAGFQEQEFDAIVAADVLEHFRDLRPAVSALHQWLKSDGYLFTSLPTENSFYHWLRKVFKIVKPEDHYHTGTEVETYLEENGFALVDKKYSPLIFNLFPLFIISSWQKKKIRQDLSCP